MSPPTLTVSPTARPTPVTVSAKAPAPAAEAEAERMPSVMLVEITADLAVSVVTPTAVLVRVTFFSVPAVMAASIAAAT